MDLKFFKERWRHDGNKELVKSICETAGCTNPVFYAMLRKKRYDRLTEKQRRAFNVAIEQLNEHAQTMKAEYDNAMNLCNQGQN